MIVGFKRRFEPYVKDGTKRHTLRDPRAGDRQIEVGDRLDCYGDVRQKTEHLLGRWPCTRVQEARFELHEDRGPVMSIDGVELSIDEANAFAWRDGFRWIEAGTGFVSAQLLGCFGMMMKYWIDDGKVFPFTKRLIHWNFDKPMPGPDGE